MSEEEFIKALKDGYNSLTRKETIEEKSFEEGYTYAVNRMFYLIKELQEENEKLSKNQRYYKNGVFSLEYDKETMSDIIDDYKSRVDKAIKYINKVKAINDEEDDNMYWEYEVFFPNMLNILQGDDNK